MKNHLKVEPQEHAVRVDTKVSKVGERRRADEKKLGQNDPGEGTRRGECEASVRTAKTKRARDTAIEYIQGNQ